MPRFVTYTPDLLPAVVDFWNRTFADRRNFVPITVEIFERRVVDVANAVESFDPRGLLLAVEADPSAPGPAGRVVGAVHVGIWPEAFVRAMEKAWPGGARGYIALLAVDPAFRRRRIGSELWTRAAAQLRDCRDIILDGQCLNPFYGNSDGPETPFWGTPEGISVSWNDWVTRRFFERRGYRVRHRASHLRWTPDARPSGITRVLRLAAGLSLSVLESRYPETGKKLTDAPRHESPHPYTCVAAADKAERVCGLISFFPLRGVGAGCYAIFEWLVTAEMRQTGTGWALMSTAIELMRKRGAKSCDALTLPDLSPAAHELYLRWGFREVDAWAIF